MASFGHIAVGMAAGRAYVPRGKSPVKAMVVLSILSMLPDADVIGFSFGVPYWAPFGHRGASHSIAVALLMALIASQVGKLWHLDPKRTGLFVAVVGVSHGLLDTLTFGGGLGVALLWPFSTERFWAPLRFIPISPIGMAMFSQRGALVVIAELVIFSPFWIYALWPPHRREPVT